MQANQAAKFFHSAKSKFPGNYFSDYQLTRTGKLLRDSTSYNPETGELILNSPITIVGQYEDLSGNGLMLWLTLPSEDSKSVNIAVSKPLLIYSLVTKKLVNLDKIPRARFLNPDSESLFAWSNLEFNFSSELPTQGWIDRELAIAQRKKTMNPNQRASLKISPTFGVVALDSGKFMSRYKQQSLGTFADPESAAEAYLETKIKEAENLGILTPVTELRWRTALMQFKQDPIMALQLARAAKLDTIAAARTVSSLESGSSSGRITLDDI